MTVSSLVKTGAAGARKMRIGLFAQNRQKRLQRFKENAAGVATLNPWACPASSSTQERGSQNLPLLDKRGHSVCSAAIALPLGPAAPRGQSRTCSIRTQQRVRPLHFGAGAFCRGSQAFGLPSGTHQQRASTFVEVQGNYSTNSAQKSTFEPFFLIFLSGRRFGFAGRNINNSILYNKLFSFYNKNRQISPRRRRGKKKKQIDTGVKIEP